MTTEEHLKRIRARCVELLALAEKRTQGEWEAFQRNEEIGTNYCRITFTDRNSDSLHGYCGENNATYIAACAGAAEAGWRSTIAAIETLLAIQLSDRLMNTRTSHVQSGIDAILAAWPEELL